LAEDAFIANKVRIASTMLHMLAYQTDTSLTASFSGQPEYASTR